MRQQMSGWQLACRPKCAERRRNVAVGEVAVDRLVVDVARDLRVLHQRRELGGEAESPVALGKEERLLAHTVAGHDVPPAPGVPEGEAEHAVEGGYAIDPPLLVE